jgi:hypothetical protein
MFTKRYHPSCQPQQGRPCRERTLLYCEPTCINRDEWLNLRPLELPPVPEEPPDEPSDPDPEVAPPCFPASWGSTLPWANSDVGVSRRSFRIGKGGTVPPVPTRLSGVPSCFRPSCSVRMSDYCHRNNCGEVVTSGLVLVRHCDVVNLIWVVMKLVFDVVL